MGTQQVLLIVLSVIIVGVAVAGGIGMFNQQAERSNRAAIIADMNLLGVQAIAYYRMPKSMGGGGGEFDQDGLISWFGMPTSNNGKRVLTGNGYIKVKVFKSGRVRFTGFGNEIGNNEKKAVKARLILKGIDSKPVLKIFN